MSNGATEKRARSRITAIVHEFTEIEGRYAVTGLNRPPMTREEFERDFDVIDYHVPARRCDPATPTDSTTPAGVEQLTAPPRTEKSPDGSEETIEATQENEPTKRTGDPGDPGDPEAPGA